MQFNLFTKIGAVLAVLGIIGYVIIFPAVLAKNGQDFAEQLTVDANGCLLYTSPSPRDGLLGRMPSCA